MKATSMHTSGSWSLSGSRRSPTCSDEFGDYCVFGESLRAEEADLFTAKQCHSHTKWTRDTADDLLANLATSKTKKQAQSASNTENKNGLTNSVQRSWIIYCMHLASYCAHSSQ